MNRKNLTTAVIAGLAGVAGIANMANAVNLNPDGLGQVLLYPYYTVNGHQQTLLSVVNTANVGKIVKVRFLEAYNSREVLDFNLYLSAHDVWTANVFSLSDGPVSGAGAGIFTTDKSCTDPALTGSGSLPNGQGYQAFLNYAYTGGNADTGPTDDVRTREGHFEMITMADIVTGSTLSNNITHTQPAGVPPKCSYVVGLGILPAGSAVAPTSGIFGSASVVNVGQGSFYAYNADAVEGFTYTTLFYNAGSLQPNLSQVNDSANPATATSYVFTGGKVLTSTYPNATSGSRTIDAVSSLLTNDHLYNQWESDGTAVGTDWVINFPTKRFYVDSQPGGVIPAQTFYPPFEEYFGQNTNGQSCIAIGTTSTGTGTTTVYNREEGFVGAGSCPISPCKPGASGSTICLETNVLTFQANSVLASGLPSQSIASAIPPGAKNGWVDLDLTDGTLHALSAATNGNVFHGLPVNGFEAVKFTNGNLNGVLANYAGVYRHRGSRNCTNATTGACS